MIIRAAGGGIYCNVRHPVEVPIRDLKITVVARVFEWGVEDMLDVQTIDRLH